MCFLRTALLSYSSSTSSASHSFKRLFHIFPLFLGFQHSFHLLTLSWWLYFSSTEKIEIIEGQIPHFFIIKSAHSVNQDISSLPIYFFPWMNSTFVHWSTVLLTYSIKLFLQVFYFLFCFECYCCIRNSSKTWYLKCFIISYKVLWIRKWSAGWFRPRVCPWWQQSDHGGNQCKWSTGSGEAGDWPAVISYRLRILSSLPKLLWASLQPSKFRSSKHLHGSLGLL